MKTLPKLINEMLKLIILIGLFLPFTAMAGSDVMTFYKDPTYKNFIESSTSFNYIEKSDDPYFESKMLIFTTLVLNKHPDFGQKLVKDFDSLNTHQKRIIYKGLMGAGLTKEANEITRLYQYKAESNANLTVEKINNLTFLDKIETREQLDLQAATLDFCWSSYFATGDEQYIAKLVKYAKRHQNVSSKDPQFITLQAYFWASASLSKQDPAINAILVKLDAP